MDNLLFSIIRLYVDKPNDLPEDGTLCNLENPCPANRRCDNGICVDDVGNDAGVNTNPSEDGGSGEVAMQDGGSTTQVNDGGPTASSDAGIPNEPRVIGADITEPVHLTSHPVGDALIFTGQISDSLNSYDDILVEWTSDADGLLHQGTPDASGLTTFSINTLVAGYHRIVLKAESSLGVVAEDTIQIGLCNWTEATDFDETLDETRWKVYGNAYRDDRGWLEMTGNLQGKKGAIFNVVDRINPGNVVLRFKFSTGQCYEPGVCSSGDGADGFAMSVLDFTSESEVDAFFAAASTGGGLGYGVSGGYGTMDVTGFHIELDTWKNNYNGNSEFHTDPTGEDHIAITLNGDPGNHHLWAEIPDLEDNKWHVAQVEIVGHHVEVLVDDVTIIDDEIPSLDFKGGLVGFSGTTGYYTNYHRFDELEIQEECQF